jgi:electron transfer flavoprotein alpha subunit
MRGIWVYVELDENGMTDLSMQCLAKARELASQMDSSVTAVIPGHGSSSFKGEAIRRGADRELIADSPALRPYTTIPYKMLLEDMMRGEGCPDVLIFPSSTTGNDLAPFLSASLGTGCVCECDTISFEDGNLSVGRMEFDGKVLTRYRVVGDERPIVVTLKDGIAEPYEDPSRSGSSVFLDPEIPEEAMIVKVLRRDVARRSVDLRSARIIVAGGAGVGSKENFGLIEELARVLGGEVGASRPAVDAGWASADRQIGQTGVVVRPDLYIACGISGAVQHRVGMMNSKKIIAINTDPSAPIFRFAHYRIVGDLTKVIPKLIKLLGERGERFGEA